MRILASVCSTRALVTASSRSSGAVCDCALLDCSIHYIHNSFVIHNAFADSTEPGVWCQRNRDIVLYRCYRCSPIDSIGDLRRGAYNASNPVCQVSSTCRQQAVNSVGRAAPIAPIEDDIPITLT